MLTYLVGHSGQGFADAPIWCIGVLFIYHIPLSGPVEAGAAGGPITPKLVKIPTPAQKVDFLKFFFAKL